MSHFNPNARAYRSIRPERQRVPFTAQVSGGAPNDSYNRPAPRNMDPTPCYTPEGFRVFRAPPKPAWESVPDRFKQFLREDDEKIVEGFPETRVPNAALFKFNKEDHTLGNLLRAELLNNPAVIFSAYKVPHPLFANFELRVQTDGSITPKDALVQASRDLVKTLETLGREFTKEWELKRISKAADGDGMDGPNGF